jgi:hypothetical protein
MYLATVAALLLAIDDECPVTSLHPAPMEVRT